MQELFDKFVAGPGRALLHAGVNGGVVAAVASVSDPSHFNITDLATAKSLGEVFLSGFVMGLLLYLKDPAPKA